MPKRLFDRLTLFGRARLDVTIATGALRPTHGRYAVDLFHVSDPSRFRDEAVVDAARTSESRRTWPFRALHDRTYLHEGTYDAGVTDFATGDAGPKPNSLRISRRLTNSTRMR